MCKEVNVKFFRDVTVKNEALIAKYVKTANVFYVKLAASKFLFFLHVMPCLLVVSCVHDHF